ncbi:MAG: peptide deformylase [Phycisphaerales bacterium]|nr:peptide deformylase [Phycisphaerales bacterium]
MSSVIDASQLVIVHYPHPSLRTVGDPIGEPSDEVREVAARMLDLMHDASGVGLAAAQVNVPWQLFVANVPDQTDGDEVYIDPMLKDPIGPSASAEEGCLSLPEIRGQILRSPQITIEATDLAGRRFTRTAEGLLARCWQHEIDHLNGRLIIDRMPPIDRLANRRKIKELEQDFELVL